MLKKTRKKRDIRRFSMNFTEKNPKKNTKKGEKTLK